MYAYAANNPVRYIDPDGRDVKLGIRFGNKSDKKLAESQTVKKVTGYCLVALGLILDNGAPFISASVAVASGGSSAAASPALTIGLKAFGKACEAVGGSLVLEATVEDITSNVQFSSNENKPKNEPKQEYKKPKSGSGKEKANDIPSWAKGKRPYKGESGKDFAKRLCDEHFGKGNYDTKTPGKPFNQIKKWGDRGFE